MIKELRKPEEEHVRIAVAFFQEQWGKSFYWKNEVEWYFSRKYKTLIAYRKDDNEPCGILLFKVFPRAINVGYMIVSRKFRGKGVGSALVRKLINKLFNNKEMEYLFVDTRDAIGFFLKNSFLIAKGLVLTLPDEPPEYLAVFTKSRKNFIESKFIRKLLSLWIMEIYQEKELRKFREYFDLIFWNIDYISKLWKGRIFLTQVPFMRGVVSHEICRNVRIDKLKNQMIEVLAKQKINALFDL